MSTTFSEFLMDYSTLLGHWLAFFSKCPRKYISSQTISFVSSFASNIVILEIGTNDLAADRPEVVGSAIEELVHFLKEVLSIRERRFLTNLSLCLTSIFEWYYRLFRTFFAGNIEVFTALLDLLTNLMGFMSIPLVSISYIGVIGAPC